MLRCARPASHHHKCCRHRGAGAKLMQCCCSGAPGLPAPRQRSALHLAASASAPLHPRLPGYFAACQVLPRVTDRMPLPAQASACRQASCDPVQLWLVCCKCKMWLTCAGNAATPGKSGPPLKPQLLTPSFFKQSAQSAPQSACPLPQHEHDNHLCQLSASHVDHQVSHHACPDEQVCERFK